MSKLFSPLRLGDYELANRVVMAPMTRGRSDPGGIPNALMAKYYEQRATSGLIITEATAVNRHGHGWNGAPGIYTDQQAEGWRQVTQAVHDQNGRIFLQIWHMGRTVLPDFADGAVPISASPIPAEGEIPGKDGMPKPFATPREMTVEEIAQVTDDFVHAADRAVQAGFDGVEIHAANGFLLDSFLRDGTNKRMDDYGGNVQNRARFMMEVTQKIIDMIGAGKVGVRVSPTNSVFGISDSNPAGTFSEVSRMLSPLRLAYLHVLEPPYGSGHPMAPTVPKVSPLIRSAYTGTLIINGGFDRTRAESSLNANEGDAVAFGLPFISNPDLVRRMRDGIELATPDLDTFYTPGPAGYTNYPPAQGG